MKWFVQMMENAMFQVLVLQIVKEKVVVLMDA
jgi:hypothetical protein